MCVCMTLISGYAIRYECWSANKRIRKQVALIKGLTSTGCVPLAELSAVGTRNSVACMVPSGSAFNYTCTWPGGTKLMDHKAVCCICINIRKGCSCGIVRTQLISLSLSGNVNYFRCPVWLQMHFKNTHSPPNIAHNIILSA